MEEHRIDFSEFAGTYSIDEAQNVLRKMQEKLSEEKIKALNIAASHVDSDLAHIGLKNKVHREENMLKFRTGGVLDLLVQAGWKVTEVNNGTAILIKAVGEESYTYYPKSNKLQVHSSNKWITNGQTWLKENILG